MKSRLIPKTMGTQHPDNVKRPFFAPRPLLEDELEIKEAYHSFKDLGIEEQMWDFEGKETDEHVVKKLLMKYGDFFKEKVLGRDCFLTIRLPNPAVQKAEGKILLETLESIPRNYDIAYLFYKKDVPPIFEVILPMTVSAKEIIRIEEYYDRFVFKKQNAYVSDIKIKDWIGKIRPRKINVIPLIERISELIKVDEIIREYLANSRLKRDYLRVFLARSDPALNFGYVSAFLALEIALLKLDRLEREAGVEIFPIVGAGCPPFRGHFTPENVENCLNAYPSAHTFTVQSSFKYDYPVEVVREAIEKINKHERSRPREVDEQKSMDIIARFMESYQRDIEKLAPLVNIIAPYIPKRRARALHVGLFGYSRGEGRVFLPRAIPFCAALYSIGIPPEILGFESLEKEDIEYLSQDENFVHDLRKAMRFACYDVIKKQLPELKIPETLQFDSDPEYAKLALSIWKAIKFDASNLDELVLEAAEFRNFLG
ncbi:MAG: phosphoenolpyruvate carboxylase [Syntrophales bacterium]|nr:phosphoenolpyruvate carboxylase [Syntrophales bacterium]